MKPTTKKQKPKQPTSGQDDLFLSTKKQSVVPHSKSSKTAKILLFPTNTMKNDADDVVGEIPQHILDAANMTATDLRNKYPLTHNSWRNMKQRVRTQGAVIKPKFRKFKSFLRHMGPRPDKRFTLDRLDNDNPRYGPKLCAWRGKGAQANNKGNTIHLTDVDGKTLPLTHWAKITGQIPDTMRKRRLNGWNDLDLIAGRRLPGGVSAASQFVVEGGSVLDIWPLSKLEGRRRWEKHYQSKKKVNETRNQFLLRQANMRSSALAWKYDCAVTPDDLPPKLRKEGWRVWKTIDTCLEREAQIQAQTREKQQSAEPAWTDPYA